MSLYINGGNYDFYGSVNYPILLTPQFDKTSGTFLAYDKTRLNEGVVARLYHNVALYYTTAVYGSQVVD
jgi:hypothetical protein